MALLGSRYQQWLKKRFAIEKDKQLKQRDILIFVYQYGLLYGALVALTFIFGVNYGNNLILGFCFLISSLFCLSFYLTFKQLHGLNIEIIPPDIGQVNQPLAMVLILKQQIKTPRFLYVEYEDTLQRVLMTEKEQKITLYAQPKQRGAFYFSRIKVYSIYPFGLVRTWSYFYYQQVIWIAPAIQQLSLENKQQYAEFTPDVDEFRELRAFKEGDSYQAVSWKQVALGQGLFVKVFEQLHEQEQVHIIYEQMPSPLHEEKLSLMMGLIEQCYREQQAYSVQLPQQKLPYGSGYQHYIDAQKLLAQA